MGAGGVREGFRGTKSRFNGCFELPQGIVDSQKYYFPSRLAHMFRDPKHPAHGLNFHAQVEVWIVNVGPTFEHNEMRSRVQIIIAIAYALETRLNLCCLNLKSFFHIGRAKLVVRDVISVILNNSFSYHRHPPSEGHTRPNVYKCCPQY
jgi:hypothetical protein